MKKTVLGAAVIVLAACGGGEAKPTTPTTMTSASVAPPTTASAPASATSVTAPPAKLPLADLMKKNMADSDAAWAAHDAKKLSATYADDVVMSMPTPMGWMDAKKADIETQMGQLYTGFPDCKATATRVFSKGNAAIVESVFTGTNTGAMMGKPATGKKTGYHAIMINTYNDDGMVKTQHVYYDHATMFGQLGMGDPKAKVRAVENAPAGAPAMIASKDSPDEAKAIDAVRAWYGTFEKKDEKGFLGPLADDVMHLDYSQAADLKGKDAAKKEWTETFKAFPDAKVAPSNVWAFDTFVVAEYAMTGTMKGSLGPIKPTNKSGTWHGVDVFEMKNGKVGAVETYASMMETANAVGVPMPAAPAAAPVKDAPKPATPATPKK